MMRVGILVTEHARVFDYAVATEVWGLDRTARGVPRFELRTCGPHGSTVGMNPGVTCVPDHGLDGLDECDLVIVPGVQHPTAPVHPHVLGALRAAHARGATVASLCSGAFLLAAAGLLDGRRATAHWLDAEELARRHPDVTVDPNVLFVGDGAIWTSAGVAAGIDLCLHLVRSDHGAAYAAQIARNMVLPPHREGSQLQYAARPVPARADASLAPLLEWAASRLGTRLTVARLAERAGLSSRTLARQFTEQLGTSPGQWLLGRRLDAARVLLEQTDLPVEAIATRVGLASAVNLRRHFRAHLGTTPGSYRRTFSETR